jgi:hypothetical protein
MDTQLRFDLSVALSFVLWSLVVKYYWGPALRRQPGRTGFRPILLFHASRFIGLAFLVPGVVSPDLSREFAGPVAYGDLIAALLALAALAVLETRSGLAAVWAFNVWGTADLLFAFYLGLIGVNVPPGSLGAMYFIPTVVVPLLLVTHVLVFRMLLAMGAATRADAVESAQRRGLLSPR